MCNLQVWRPYWSGSGMVWVMVSSSDVSMSMFVSVSMDEPVLVEDGSSPASQPQQVGGAGVSEPLHITGHRHHRHQPTPNTIFTLYTIIIPYYTIPCHTILYCTILCHTIHYDLTIIKSIKVVLKDSMITDNWKSQLSMLTVTSISSL